MFTRVTITALVALISVSQGAAQTTYHVNSTCGDDVWTGLSASCMPPAGPKRTIQAAIDAASPGDTVLVADGTYRGDGNSELDPGGKPIVVRSQNGPAACVIDGQQLARGFYVHSGETRDTVIEGFTIRNGMPTVNWPLDGGGILCVDSSPTIRECIVSRCRTADPDGGDSGGGIACESNSHPAILDCTIADNEGHGGGVACLAGSSPLIRGCLIRANRGHSEGGGVAVINVGGGSPQIARCVIRDNDGGAGGIAGGGQMRVEDCVISGNTGYLGSVALLDGAPVVRRSIIAGNNTFGGGGVFVLSGEPLISTCRIVGNIAWDTLGRSSGGGVRDFAISPVRITVDNSLICGNHARAGGGAAWISELGELILRNCTVSGNTIEPMMALDPVGGIAYHSGTLELDQSIVWANDLAEIAGSGPATVEFSDIDGGWAGTGNLDADPSFKSGPSGFWTSDGSFSIAAGWTTFVDQSAQWTDNEFQGQICRIQGLFVSPPAHPDEWFWADAFIVGNTGTTVSVWGDYTLWVRAGMAYEFRSYHLDAVSPCVDAGDPTFISATSETDIDGERRVWPGRAAGPWTVDMGADEFGSFAFGDLNCDGRVNNFDIDPFVLALSDPGSYELTYPQCDINNADIDGDGLVNNFDIDSFVALLAGG